MIPAPGYWHEIETFDSVFLATNGVQAQGSVRYSARIQEDEFITASSTTDSEPALSRPGTLEPGTKVEIEATALPTTTRRWRQSVVSDSR